MNATLSLRFATSCIRHEFGFGAKPDNLLQGSELFMEFVETKMRCRRMQNTMVAPMFLHKFKFWIDPYRAYTAF